MSLPLWSIPAPNQFLLLGSTICLLFSFSQVFAFFPAAPKNSFFTLPQFWQGCLFPSLTFTLSNQNWTNPLSLTLDGVHSAQGKDDAQTGFVPGRSCEGIEHVQSLSVDKQHLLSSTPAALRNLHVCLKDEMHGDINF